jgi:dihydrofolate reductase
MSPDGVVEAPDKWTFAYLQRRGGTSGWAAIAASDTLLLGRRTYEDFAAYWPDKTASDDPFADYINNTPKVVVSKTLKAAEWRNSRLISSDVAKQITQLKQQPGKNISITGSATLVRSLLRENLLDQLGLLLSRSWWERESACSRIGPGGCL